MAFKIINVKEFLINGNSRKKEMGININCLWIIKLTGDCLRIKEQIIDVDLIKLFNDLID